MTVFSPYASVTATRNLMQKYGLDTKKALGQHFLINDGVVGKICALAQLNSNDVVFEIGPGIGTLTYALLKNARAVVSVERDRDMISILQETCADFVDSFALINEDALKIKAADLEQVLLKLPLAISGLAEGADKLPRDKERPETRADEALFQPSPDLIMPRKLISNLPYAVAATLVLEVFQTFSSIESATVMVQGEVADRMCAKPGSKEYGAYTVKLGLYARPAGRFAVKPQNFFPPPRVESAVLRLERSVAQDENGQRIRSSVLKTTAMIADAAFANRRKTLINSCKNYFASRGEEDALIRAKLPDILAKQGIDERARGESLSIDQFLELGKALEGVLGA